MERQRLAHFASVSNHKGNLVLSLKSGEKSKQYILGLGSNLRELISHGFAELNEFEIAHLGRLCHHCLVTGEPINTVQLSATEPPTTNEITALVI